MPSELIAIVLGLHNTSMNTHTRSVLSTTPCKYYVTKRTVLVSTQSNVFTFGRIHLQQLSEWQPYYISQKNLWHPPKNLPPINPPSTHNILHAVNAQILQHKTLHPHNEASPSQAINARIHHRFLRTKRNSMEQHSSLRGTISKVKRCLMLNWKTLITTIQNVVTHQSLSIQLTRKYQFIVNTMNFISHNPRFQHTSLIYFTGK